MVAAEEVQYWVPLEQKVVKDVYRLNSSTYLLSTTLSPVKISAKSQNISTALFAIF